MVGQAGARGPDHSLGEAGARPMLQAVGSFMRDPKGMRDLVFERSGEMRNRMNEVDRDMRDVLRVYEVRTGSGRHHGTAS